MSKLQGEVNEKTTFKRKKEVSKKIHRNVNT